MDRDTPIFLMAVQILSLTILEGLKDLNYASATIILAFSALYLVWRVAK